MKGDFTRNTFSPAKHYSRVLYQQGRVSLDADPNEQTSILLHYLRTVTRDLVGPYAAPAQGGGFDISEVDGNLQISAGRMYVDGILVENDGDCLYSEQPDNPKAKDDPVVSDQKARDGSVFWLYLDVWEAHITSIEDDSIREKALNGPDTCTRSKVVWQVKSLPQPDIKVNSDGIWGADCDAPLADLWTYGDGLMAARVDPGYKPEDVCIQPPDAKYRGAENQLYRVEIHQGGSEGAATFKWSRDNGSVVTPVLGVAHGGLEVGRTRGFSAGDWIEVLDDTVESSGERGLMLHVARIEDGILSINEDTSPSGALEEIAAHLDTAIHPKVRRWDQRENDDNMLFDGAVRVAINSNTWIDLEDGIQVRFTDGTYRTGDYWLIPARVATGNIEWPGTSDSQGNALPDSVPPAGIEHHYAPLGFVGWSQQDFHFSSCRCTFDYLSPCFRMEDGQSSRGNVLSKPNGLPKTEIVTAQTETQQAKTSPKGKKKAPS